jgi:hypothetical protein
LEGKIFARQQTAILGKNEGRGRVESDRRLLVVGAELHGKVISDLKGLPPGSGRFTSSELHKGDGHPFERWFVLRLEYHDTAPGEALFRLGCVVDPKLGLKYFPFGIV